MDAASTVELHTGRRMPVLGLGTWKFAEGAEGILRAIRAGYRLLDTSGDYGTQAEVGEAVRRSDVPRDELYVVTKVEEHDDARAAAADYVRELGLERADLILVHRPPDSGPGVELWEGLLRARDDGVASDVGVSNYSIAQLEALADETGEVPVVNQIEWTPFGHSPEMLGYCRGRGIVIQAYSPLARGRRLDDPVVRTLADAHGATPAQVVLRWSIQLGVVPIAKASAAHIEENLDVFGFELSPEEMERLGALNEGWSALGSSLQYA